MGHRWFGKPPSDDEIRTTGMSLYRLGFQDLYFHVGPVDAKANIPACDKAAWGHTLETLRRVMPGLRAFAWVGGVTVQQFGVAPDTVDDRLPQVRQALVQRCQELLQDGGFDGIHYDLESIPTEDSGFVALLTETRAAIAPHPLSIAVPPEWAEVDGSPRHSYMAQVASQCDQIALMTYGMRCSNSSEYEAALDHIVHFMCDLLAGSKTRFVMGVPTYGEPDKRHDPAVENAATALVGVSSGLRWTYDRRPFQGVAVYAQWTTSPAAWDQFEQDWLR
jgi:hypothetical protein